MPRLRRPSLAVLAALAASSTPGRGHEEWHNLHIVYSARTSYTYPFDGRTPKLAVALLNHHEVPGPPVTFTLNVNGRRAAAGAFATYPDGGNIITGPDDFGLASVLTGGVYDGAAGPPPAVGETTELTFQFVFALAPGAVAPPGSGVPANPDPARNGDLPGTTTATVRFTHLGENPVLAGPLAITGSVRVASRPGDPTGTTPPPASLRVEVATAYSNWFPVALNPGAPAAAATFAQDLPARDDWLLRFSADGAGTRIVPVGFVNDPHPPLEVTLPPAAPPEADYRRLAAIPTPTGFWRGAVAEAEGTFAAFPGQATWRAAATDAEARALRAASRIYKCRFDGTRLWEHAPGWETWAGDMTPDGRFVAYALHPAGQPFFTPAEHKLVLLDGATGAVLWTKSAPPGDAALGRRLDALELAFSPDARWIAVGSAAGGTVTLIDRPTGNIVWTTPGAGATPFGQVRALRFSADARFLFCGSGDSSVRKLRVSDGAVLWRVLAGGWPDVSGLDLAPDGAWLVAGTRSLDTSLIRTSDGLLQWQREAQFPDAVFAPDGRHVVTRGGQVYRTIDGSLAGLTKTAGRTRFTPDSRYLLQAGRDLRLFDLGGKPLQTFEPSGLDPAGPDQPPWMHVTRDGRYVILLGRDLPAPPQTGIVVYERRAAAGATAPALTTQPMAQTVGAGAAVLLGVTATGTPPLAYQWRRDGVDLATAAGAAGPVLALANASAADAGTYTCVVTNAAGGATSAGAVLAVTPPDAADPARLANLAVRATVGAAPLIVGFSVGGAGTAGTKPLLVRGVGPSLAALGVTGVLADPRLELFSGATRVFTNDDWGGESQVAALATRLGAFPLAAGTSRDAALVATTVGGSFTAQLASADGTRGTALAEIYDGSAGFGPATPRLVNVSARTEVGGAAGVLIAGFVVAGGTARTVLIRGIGPALAGFGVAGGVADPQLTLFRDGTVVAVNDDWHDAANAPAIAAGAAQVGAFALAPASRDAAILISLPAGSYTAQLSAPEGNGGSALVEVYEVP